MELPERGTRRASQIMQEIKLDMKSKISCFKDGVLLHDAHNALSQKFPCFFPKNFLQKDEPGR